MNRFTGIGERNLSGKYFVFGPPYDSKTNDRKKHKKCQQAEIHSLVGTIIILWRAAFTFIYHIMKRKPILSNCDQKTFYVETKLRVVFQVETPRACCLDRNQCANFSYRENHPP